MAKKRRANSEGSIYQRADGTWEAKISLAGGKRMSLYAKTQRELMVKVKDSRKRIDANLPPAPERLTVATFLQEWLQEHVKPTVDARTHFDYSSITRLHLTPEIGHIKLVRLTARDVQSLLNKKRKAGLSQRRIQYIHAVLRAALFHAQRMGIVGQNVAKLVQVKTGHKKEVQPFTPEEARLFLHHASEAREEAAFVLALTLGLRQGEVAGLQWSDVDLNRGTLSGLSRVFGDDGSSVFSET